MYEAKRKKTKPMKFFSVGTCWGWRALDSVSALWTAILPRSSLLLQSLADTLCPALFVKEGMRKYKKSELFMLHSKYSINWEWDLSSFPSDWLFKQCLKNCHSLGSRRPKLCSPVYNYSFFSPEHHCKYIVRYHTTRNGYPYKKKTSVHKDKES